MFGLKRSKVVRAFWAEKGVTFTNREWRGLRRRSYRIEWFIRLRDAWDALRGVR